MRPFFRPVWFISRLPRVAPQIVVPYRLKSTSTKKPAEELTKKSTKVSKKKSIKESIKESVKKSTNKSVRKSTKEPTKKPVKESVTESIKKLTQKLMRIDVPKLIIAPGSIHHNSLPTFLKYAEETGLNPESTNYIGTHYEYTVALSVRRFGFSLQRVGRKQDAGIDLIGHMSLDHISEKICAIVQCKAQKSSIQPAHIRELEGSFRGIPAGWKKKNVLAILVTPAKSTPGILDALRASEMPMGFMSIDREGRIKQFLFNHRATEIGLEGLGVTLRHTPRIFMTEAELEEGDESTEKKGKRHMEKFKFTGTVTDIQLTFKGKPIFPKTPALDPEAVEPMDEIEVGEIEESDSPEDDTTPKKRGRPKGSKNKPKLDPDIA